MKNSLMLGIATISVPLGSIYANGSDLSKEQAPVPPKPWAEICQAIDEAEDGEGLDPVIAEFLEQLDLEGPIRECGPHFANSNSTNNPRPPEELSQYSEI